MNKGYIFVDNLGGDVYVNRQVFWTRDAAEEALEAWMTSMYEGIQRHEDGNWYDNGDFVQAYVQEIDIPE